MQTKSLMSKQSEIQYPYLNPGETSCSQKRFSNWQQLAATVSKEQNTFVRWLSLCLLVFVLSASSYAFLIPPFENSDEDAHLAYATCWATLIGKGVQAARGIPNVAQERYQPPVYYLSCVPLVWFYDLTGNLSFPKRDPTFNYSPASPGHGPHRLFTAIDQSSTAEMLLTVRACRAMRFISLAWAVAACIFGAVWIWELSGNNLPLTLTATNLFALNPRWVEASISIGNDAAAVCMANVVIWLLLNTLRAQQPPSKGRIVVLGLACSAAALIKFNGLGLAPIALITILVKNHWSSPSWRYQANSAVTFLLSAFVPLAPWLIANFIFYGDPLAMKRELWAPFVRVRANDFGTLDFLGSEFQGFRWSYWAVFGQFAVLMHGPVYWLLDGFLLTTAFAALVFLLKTIVNGSPREAIFQQLLPAIWAGVLLIMFLQYNRIVYASQGRLLFPAGFCISYYMSAGTFSLLPKVAANLAAVLISLAMICFVWYVGIWVLWPAYHAATTAAS